MENTILTENLCKRFGTTVAVDNLNLAVKAGEIYGFLGPNGSGKTTTIKMLTGLLEPSSGRTIICGHDLATEATRAKALLAYVPDQPKLYGKLSAREFLFLMADLYRMPREISRNRARELLAMFQLEYRQNELLEGFSHGMRQKVVLAAALIHQPKVLLMDEPTVGLDPASARLLKDILVQLADGGATIFISTHILEIAERMCNRVGILQEGRLIAQGNPEELRRQAGSQDSLEDIFLKLTGSEEHRELIASLDGNRQ